MHVGLHDVITMHVGLPEWENIITAGATEKNDVIFSKRQTSIQSEVGPLNPAIGSGGALWAPQRDPGQSSGRNGTFEILLYWFLNGYGFLSFEFFWLFYLHSVGSL